jgi:apolipoprotein N-acyltransferase
MSDQWGRKAYLPLLAGVTVALSMPGLGIGPLAFVGLVPLLFALEKGRGFLPGFLTGFVFFALDLRWLLTLYRFSPLVVPGYMVLVVYLAAYLGLFGLFMGWVRGRRAFDWSLLVLAPAGFALLEVLRAYGPLGTGFSALYLSLYRFPLLIQLAAVAGPWAVTTAIVFINVALYLSIRRRAIYFLLGVGMMGLLAVFSGLSLPQGGEPLSVAVVSSAVPQEVKLDGRNLFSLLEKYIAL